MASAAAGIVAIAVMVAPSPGLADSLPSAPFAWQGQAWCPSYHAYWGCDSAQSPVQFSVSFSPQQVATRWYVSLQMNSTATVSGAINTYGYETWTPPVTLTETINLPCDTFGQIENWPAFWAVGTVGPYPSNGEIDIMEGLNGQPTWGYHYVNAAGQNDSRGGVVPGNWCGTHTYAITWTASAIIWTWDGAQVGQVTSADIGVPIVSDPMYVIDDYGAGSAGGPTAPSVAMKVISFSAS